MKPAYIAVIRVLMDVDSEAAAWGLMTAHMTENLQKYSPTSCILDWQYETYGGPMLVEIKDDYDVDKDRVPPHSWLVAGEM